MRKNTSIILNERIEGLILLIRGKKVILDSDLADLYGVLTKVLNQAVKRNESRFPPDFMMQLIKQEKDELVTNCDRFKRLKHSSALPRAFTEQGIAMLATVLNSDKAIQVNIAIIRAFVKLREILSTHKDLAHKLIILENKLTNHDEEIHTIFEAIRLMKAIPRMKKITGFGKEGK